MFRPRVIPSLLLYGGGLTKTVRFGHRTYIGDPINTIRIFNDLMVDELILLDIAATKEGREPPLATIEDVASECFIPLTYGGGVTSLLQIERILALGVEKVAINSYAVRNPDFIEEAAREFGSQSIIVSLDVKKSMWSYRIFTHGGTRKTNLDPVSAGRQFEAHGAGELLVTAVDRDGTMIGYDLRLIQSVTEAVDIPVCVSGGAGSTADLKAAVDAGASAAVAASMFVYHGKHRGVLINFPSQEALEILFQER